MSDFIDALLRGDTRVFPLFLVAASMLLYMLGSNMAWLYRTAPEHSWAARIRRAALTNLVRAVYEIFRLVYYFGVPSLAVLLGLVDIRAMGLGFLDWSNGLRWTFVLVLAAWSLLMFVWVPYLRASSDLPVKFSSEVYSWSRRALEVIYMQAHWALYRAAAILFFAGFLKDDAAVYWGASAGLALTYIEAFADPRLRRHLAQFGEGELTLWSAAQAIINTLGFVLTRNVWLLAIVHLLLEFSVPHLRGVPATSTARASSVNAAETK